VVENALSLLLGGAGYDTKVLEDPSASAANAEEQLVGVDLLLLTPSLREETQEAFLKAIEAAPAAAGVPVLTLSTAPQDELNDRTGMVPWPTPLEHLRRAIEAALVSVPSGEPGGAERPPSRLAGDGGAAAREWA
jgi:sugar/nucleoside kinase (ribokinase family)